MFKVIKFFTDLQDNEHPYNEGDTFPRKGLTVTEARLAELASSSNKQHQPLIVHVEEAPKADDAPKKANTKKAAKKTAE